MVDINPEPISPEAHRVFQREVSRFNRVLILGGSGWFGRTALAMMPENGVNFLVIGRTRREIVVADRIWPIKTWATAEIESFCPQLVLDFAFLTRDVLANVGEGDFLRQTREINRRLFRVLELGSVSRLLTISSGAAVGHNRVSGRRKDAYSEQKHANDLALRQVARLGKVEVTIARAWSVSGRYVQKPRNYAFSDFLLSAWERGYISVRADHFVYRRYCAVEELLAIGLGHPSSGGLLEFDSGGHLLELAELAQVMTERLELAPVRISCSARSRGIADHYYSDGQQWVDMCARLGLEPSSVSEQIARVWDAIPEWGNRCSSDPV